MPPLQRPDPVPPRCLIGASPVQVVTVYLAPKGKSRRYGLPGMDQAAQRDHTLSRPVGPPTPPPRGSLSVVTRDVLRTSQPLIRWR